jgi:hypothetical protein
MAQRENLGFKLRPRMDTGANGGEERHQNGAHVRTPHQPGAANPKRDKRTEFPITTGGGGE